MATRRRSKYKPNQENKPPLRFNDGDVVILDFVQQYRYLTTPILSLLTGRIPKVINERTQKLWLHGYLGRLHLPHTYTGGSSPSIHVLNERGRQFLAGHFDRPLSAIGTSPLAQENPEKHLKHSLLVSHIHAAVEVACRQNPHLRLLFWHNESNHYRTKVMVKGKKITVKPDSFFGILDTRRPSGRQRLHFFIEADRSTMPHADMIRKFQAYLTLWREHNKQPISAFDDITSYRVLTVIEKDSDRLPHLIEDAREATESGGGSNMFWFCSQDDLPLAQPGRFFAAVWRIGKRADTELHSLTE